MRLKLCLTLRYEPNCLESELTMKVLLRVVCIVSWLAGFAPRYETAVFGDASTLGPGEPY